MKRAKLLVDGVVSILACGAIASAVLVPACDDSPKPDRGVLNGRSDGLIKYRDEANHVTCYVRDWSNNSDGALSCLRDPEPMPSCSGVPR